jgi:hypothetical protein
MNLPKTNASIDGDLQDADSSAMPAFSSRRQMLTNAGGLLAAVVGGIAAAMPSDAVDTITAVGGVKVSKRAGGLAQKIRGGVCFKMVSSILFCKLWDLACCSLSSSFIPTFPLIFCRTNYKEI